MRQVRQTNNDSAPQLIRSFAHSPAHPLAEVVVAIMSLARLAYTLSDYSGPCMGKQEKAHEGAMAAISTKKEGLWGKTGGEYVAAENKNLGH